MKKHKVSYCTPLAYKEIANYLTPIISYNTIIVCIGTDKCIPDSLGPLVGTFLKNNNFQIPVYGTLDSPIHALNIDSEILKIKSKHPNTTIIGIDACLGDKNSIGEIHIRDFPINPGKGVGKTLPQVGDFSIIGIVDSSDNANFFNMKSIRLNTIYNMAQVISDSLIESLNQHIY